MVSITVNVVEGNKVLNFYFNGDYWNTQYQSKHRLVACGSLLLQAASGMELWLTVLLPLLICIRYLISKESYQTIPNSASDGIILAMGTSKNPWGPGYRE